MMKIKSGPDGNLDLSIGAEEEPEEEDCPGGVTRREFLDLLWKGWLGLFLYSHLDELSRFSGGVWALLGGPRHRREYFRSLLPKRVEEINEFVNWFMNLGFENDSRVVYANFMVDYRGDGGQRLGTSLLSVGKSKSGDDTDSCFCLDYELCFPKHITTRHSFN